MTTRPKLYISSLVSLENPTLRRVRRLSPPKRYELTQHLDDADIALFVESGYCGLDIYSRLRELRKLWKGDLFVFSESDWPFPLLPGLYPSLTKSVPWAHSWSFLIDDEPMTDPSEKRYLFSFLGRVSTHPVRNEVLKLDSATTPCIDISSAPERFPDWSNSETYNTLLCQSTFALCPRGIGVSSIRLFEAMRAGCVPVIISDNWIEPSCGEWSNFSIRIREGQVSNIPDICASRLDDAQEMGYLAAKTFKEYFAPDVFLDRAVDFIREHSMSDPRDTFVRSLSALSLREFRDVLARIKRRALMLHQRFSS